MFKFVSESSVAAGIRRVEAITGKNCEEAVYALEDTMKAVKALFNNAKDLKGAIQKFLDENEAIKKQVEGFKAQAVERTKDKLLSSATEVNGVKVIKAVLPIDADSAKNLVFKLRESVPSKLLCVIGSTGGNKPLLSVMLSDDMVKEHNLNAGAMVKEAAKLIKGGGGGQPHYASAGGKDLDGISVAVDKVIELAQLA